MANRPNNQTPITKLTVPFSPSQVASSRQWSVHNRKYNHKSPNPIKRLIPPFLAQLMAHVAFSPVLKIINLKWLSQLVQFPLVSSLNSSTDKVQRKNQITLMYQLESSCNLSSPPSQLFQFSHWSSRHQPSKTKSYCYSHSSSDATVTSNSSQTNNNCLSCHCQSLRSVSLTQLYKTITKNPLTSINDPSCRKINSYYWLKFIIFYKIHRTKTSQPYFHLKVAIITLSLTNEPLFWRIHLLHHNQRYKYPIFE